jgi:hypothetical protein
MNELKKLSFAFVPICSIYLRSRYYDSARNKAMSKKKISSSKDISSFQ